MTQKMGLLHGYMVIRYMLSEEIESFISDGMITLKTLHEYTMQEVFDFVGNHMLKQNETSVKSWDGEETCMYRLQKEDGTILRCAVGCLIPDEDYTSNMEDKTILNMQEQGIINIQSMDVINLLTSLQETHDYTHPSKWGMSLKEIAKQYHLNVDNLIW